MTVWLRGDDSAMKISDNRVFFEDAIAGKPAPTGFCVEHTICEHHQSLWERACPRSRSERP